MQATLMPERFVLDKLQMAAAMAMSGLLPESASPLPNLPPVADPGAALRGTPMLGSDGRLTAEARAALTVLAAPRRLLTVRVNRAGQPAWTESNLVQGAGEPVAVLSATDAGWDVALLPTTMQAALMVNDLLQLTALPSLPGGRVIELDLPGYGAALAMADAVQAAHLGARLARVRRPLPPLTPEVLEGMLQKGMTAQDTRWAVTAARLSAPVNLGELQGKMAEGLKGLAAAGLTESGAEGARLTAQGAALAGAFGELINAGSLVLAAASGEGRVAVAHTGVFRCTTEVWLAVWSGKGGVQLRHVSGSTAVRFVSGLLTPDGPQ